MKKILENLGNNLINNYAIREESNDEGNYIVVPVVMMVEGVHSGSRGPMLYTTEELKNSATSWDGEPIVVHHPQNANGQFVPVDSPDAVDAAVVGTIRNSHMDGSKLKADAWIDVATLRLTSAIALQHITDQHPLDVSIGVLSDEESVEGEFNNEQYQAIAHNLRPDHLALLPGGTGACSWDDGCGIRVNENKFKFKTNKNEVKDESLTIEQMNAKLSKNSLAFPVLNGLGELTVNEMGFREISDQIQGKLNTFDSDSKYYYLEEVFEGHAIYRVHNREERTAKFFKRSYQVENGAIQLVDDAVEVMKDITYQEVATPAVNKLVRKKPKEKIMNKKASPCSIDALIANEANQFGEDDREWLGNLDEVAFNKLIPKEEKIIDNKKVDDDNPADAAANAVKEFFANQKTPEDFINLMPGELGEQMKEGLKLRNNRRTALIDGIVANSKFTKEDLANHKNDMLETLHSSVVPEGEDDYSALGELELADNSDDDGLGNALDSMNHIKEEK